MESEVYYKMKDIIYAFFVLITRQTYVFCYFFLTNNPLTTIIVLFIGCPWELRCDSNIFHPKFTPQKFWTIYSVFKYPKMNQWFHMYTSGRFIYLPWIAHYLSPVVLPCWLPGFDDWMEFRGWPRFKPVRRACGDLLMLLRRLLTCVSNIIMII